MVDGGGRSKKVSATCGSTDKRLVPISSYLLPTPPPSSTLTSEPPVPTFRRPSPIKRSSLPFTSSAPSSPITDRGDEIRRSPSPETIARMSMTGAPSSSRSRAPSFDQSPSFDRRRSREASLPILPKVEEVAQPKSPKPEADGKLDRCVLQRNVLIRQRFQVSACTQPCPFSYHTHASDPHCGAGHYQRRWRNGRDKTVRRQHGRASTSVSFRYPRRRRRSPESSRTT
jgi:hypothetical protein